MVTYDWWSFGTAPRKYGLPLTHQNARLSMTNNRVFGRSSTANDIWDLRDSVLELFENEHRLEDTLRLRYDEVDLTESDTEIDEDTIFSWLADNPGNGFIRIYPPDTNEFSRSRLIPCNLKTPAYQICQQLAIGINVLHLQMNGDIIRRLEPHELPLNIQNDFLVSLGYSDVIRIQEEGPKDELAYLIKFYSGKPKCDSGQVSNQIQGHVQVKRGGIFQHWTSRWCAIYNTRIHLYKDQHKKDSPTIFQLMGGMVERTQSKNFHHCLKITTKDGDKQFFLSFASDDECLMWLKRCKKVTDRLPTTADLSCCHLEYLPENIFINAGLTVLNLQHNLLKDRTNDEDTMLGWIDDLCRFEFLRSLNLADNNIQQFPPSICKINPLVELNLASNKIKEIPANIKLLENLQVLHLHNNHLTNLPDEIISLKKLSVLILAFNRFTNIPTVVAQITNIRFSEVESVIMAGNQIEKIATDVLMELKHARKLDLRLNLLTLPLTETMKFSVLEHLSHLDVRDNQISELDLRSVKTLELLSCERNGMTSLSLHGGSLKVLLASCNCLDQIVIFPKPDSLVHFDMSDNCLEYLPDWLSDCYQLKKLIAHENFLRELPPRLFASTKKLSHINLAHNHLTSLPCEIGELLLEDLQIQHNYIFSLPQNLLKRLTRLTVFNSSQSLLQSLPRLHENTDLNRLQELYLSGNFLSNDALKIISGYTRLKILNLAHNEISELYDEDIVKLVMLQELNISSNQLQSLPHSLGTLPNLAVLRAHSNFLTSLPNFSNAKSLRVLDVGHNKLLNISVTSLIASKLNLLDIGLNEQLKVDRAEFKNVIGKKNICLVDSSGQNRKLPGLTRKRFISNVDTDDPSNRPWKVGFSESTGSRNKLYIQIVKNLDFNNNCLVGIFDGGKNSELPRLLAKSIKRIIQEELSHPVTREKFMKYAFLTAHRSLKLTGQKLGVSAALCHIQKTITMSSSTSSSTSNGNKFLGQRFNFVLTIGNVGDVEAVLCRKGEAVLLTRKFAVPSDSEEAQRVCKSDGIITEDGKVNGVTPCSRLLGCAHLYPHVIPEPFSASIPLQNDDEFVIIGNSSFWKYVPYEEAVEEAYNLGNPIVASKHLQDLAECYGSKENIAVLVLRLNTEPGPTLGRLKPPHREMSIDDVEAAIQHDMEMVQRRANQKKLIGGQHLQQMGYMKNRQFFQQSLFSTSPVTADRSLNNNNIIGPSKHFDNEREKVATVVKFKNDEVAKENNGHTTKTPSTTTSPEMKVVSFPSPTTTLSTSTDSTRGSRTSASSFKSGIYSINESHSSTTCSQKSSLEGSVNFTHNGHHGSPQINPRNVKQPMPTSQSTDHIDNTTVSPTQVSTAEAIQNFALFQHRAPVSPPKPVQKPIPPLPPVKKPPINLPRFQTPPSLDEHLTPPKTSSPEVHSSTDKDEDSGRNFPALGRKTSEETDDFQLHLKVDGPCHRRTVKSKPANDAPRPQSRFIKRTSALDAVIIPKNPQTQIDMCRSSDSLLSDNATPPDPNNHLSKIAAAKEKKLSMYVASGKAAASPYEVHVPKTKAYSSSGTNNPGYVANSSADVKDLEIIDIMTTKPPVPPPKRKRGSIMNTIAMFESVNSNNKGMLSPSQSVQDLFHDTNVRIGQVTSTKTSDENFQDANKTEMNFKGILNPANYQLSSALKSPEKSRNSYHQTGKPSTIIRSSYISNVRALPKSHYEFNREAKDSRTTTSDKPVKIVEIAKL